MKQRSNRKILAAVSMMAVVAADRAPGGDLRGSQAGAGIANVSAVVRVVKTGSPAGAAWQDARLGDPLGAGQRLRTGRRSKAGMRFRDGSVLRIDELSEVVVQNSGTREITVNRGALFGSFRGPGTVSGGYAVAAVKGTEFEFRTRGRETLVRCFTGVVYVGPGGADVRAGAADSGTRTTIVDDALIGQRRRWVGETLRVMAGPDTGERRRVVAFDADTGTITVDRPFRAPAGPGFDYLLTTAPDMPMVPLTAGMETTVVAGRVPAAPRRAAPQTFAGGQEKPWFEQVPEGQDIQEFAGSETHEEVQTEGSNLTEAAGATGNLEEGFGTTEVLRDGGATGGEAVIVLPTPGGRKGGEAEVVIPTPAQPTRTARLGLPVASVSAGGGATLPLLLLAAPPTSYRANGERGGLVWESEPYTFGSDGGESLGSRARLRLVGKRTLAVTGARAVFFKGKLHTDLSEAFVLHRSSRWGDLKVGRQYLFVGPANNSDLGKLIGFETADAAIWSSTAGRRMRYHFGYVLDTAPLERDGFSGWFARAQGRVGRGAWGVNFLTANRAGGGLGESVDLSLPLLPNRLDVYGEVGRDPFRRDLVTAGLYFPGIFQRTGLDTFLEYQSRSGFEDRVSLRLRAQVAPNWLVFGTIAGELGGKTSTGLGIQYRWRSR